VQDNISYLDRVTREFCEFRRFRDIVIFFGELLKSDKASHRCHVLYRASEMSFWLLEGGG